jgi:Uma2 family endonuclease
MALHEIVLPDTKPYLEWIDGKAVAKVSPTYSHSLVQGRLFILLSAWSARTKLGRVGMEWRFRLAPPGELIRPLIPDAAFISLAALPASADTDDVENPLAAPTVAFEVRSHGDRERELASKIRTYLAAGTVAAVVCAPREQQIHVHEAGRSATLRVGDTFTHPEMPGFAIVLAELFAPDEYS